MTLWSTPSSPVVTIQTVALVVQGWPSSKGDVTPSCREDLSVISRCLLRGCRVVIPSSLRSRMLELAHKGHPGVVRIKNKCRETILWPGIDADIERYVRDCSTYVRNFPSDRILISYKSMDQKLMTLLEPKCSRSSFGNFRKSRTLPKCDRHSVTSLMEAMVTSSPACNADCTPSGHISLSCRSISIGFRASCDCRGLNIKTGRCQVLLHTVTIVDIAYCYRAASSS